MTRADSAAQMTLQLTSSYSQAEVDEVQVHFHNDHQIPFHLEEGGGMDEMEIPCTSDDLPLYSLPNELRLGHLCDVRQGEDSNEKTKQEHDCVNM